MADLEQTGLDAETLDRVEVLYAVKASFVIGASVSAGVSDRATLAALIMDRGVHEDDIDEMTIIEVTVDDKVVARA